VTVSKDLVVRERAVVRRAEVADVALVEAEVRREELRTSTEGAVEFDSQDENIRGGEARRCLPGE
jgi:stress response protein YsnF